MQCRPWELRFRRGVNSNKHKRHSRHSTSSNSAFVSKSDQVSRDTHRVVVTSFTKHAGSCDVGPMKKSTGHIKTTNQEIHLQKIETNEIETNKIETNKIETKTSETETTKIETIETETETIEIETTKIETETKMIASIIIHVPNIAFNINDSNFIAIRVLNLSWVETFWHCL